MAPASSPLVEEDIGILSGLLDASSRATSFEASYIKYALKIGGELRRCYPFLRSEELADIVQDTFIALWDKVVKGNLALNGNFYFLLITIAKRLAVNEIRERQRYQRLMEAIRAAIAETLRETQTGSAWKRTAELGFANEVMAHFCRLADQLPTIQKHVALAMVQCITADDYTNRLGNETLQALIFAQFRIPYSIEQIKVAKNQIRIKFRRILNARAL